MNRTTIFLPPELQQRLADEARRRKVAQAELVREALTAYLDRSRRPVPSIIGVVDRPDIDARDAKAWVRERWAEEAGQT